MICQCFGRSFDLVQLGRRLSETADLMVGLPDYDAYLAHVTARHPGTQAMTREAFFRNRQSARYGSRSGFRCC
jgi:uncharacterized short protein YbdD (DUF466 family)